jgi:hypothetical protein
MKNIKTILENWFSPKPAPAITSAPVLQPVVAAIAPPCVAKNIDLCWLAWERILNLENIYEGGPQDLIQNKVDKEWEKNLQAGKAVLCIINYFPESGGLHGHPTFHYPDPIKLAGGLGEHFLATSDYFKSLDYSIEKAVYRLDLGPPSNNIPAPRFDIPGLESKMLDTVKAAKLKRLRSLSIQEEPPSHGKSR